MKVVPNLAGKKLDSLKAKRQEIKEMRVKIKLKIENIKMIFEWRENKSNYKNLLNPKDS